MKKLLSLIFAILFIYPVQAYNERSEFSSRIPELELQYDVEIREVPQWASAMADRYLNSPTARLWGLSWPDNNKMLLFTEKQCEYVKWRTFYHELGHIKLGTTVEEFADKYADKLLNKNKIRYTDNCFHLYPKSY